MTITIVMTVMIALTLFVLLFNMNRVVETNVLPPFQKNKELCILFLKNTHLFYKRVLVVK